MNTPIRSGLYPDTLDLEQHIPPVLPGPSPVKVLGLALIYFVVGAVSLFLTIPLGYASPIFPPAGIALGGLLLLGRNAWPGILLGSFLVQLWLNWSGGFQSDPGQMVLSALLIACGASLQAVLGQTLIRRTLGPAPSLATTRDAALFLGLGGGLSTLLSASIGSSVLVLTERIPEGDAYRNWLSWWVGDSLGVMLVAPLILAWFSKHVQLWRERRRLLTWTSVILSILLIASIGSLEKWEQERMGLTLQQRADVLVANLKMTLHRNLEALRALRSLYDASTLVERAEFRRFTQQFLEDLPDLIGLSWNPLVHPSQRAALEAQARAEGLLDYRIHPVPGLSESDRAGANAANAPTWHAPVFYIEPMQANAAALGLDVASEPVRRKAIERARDSGEATATAPLRLVQAAQSTSSILIFYPVYSKSGDIESLEGRRQSVQGYMVAVLHLERILKLVATPSHEEGIRYRLVDATDARAPLPIHSSYPATHGWQALENTQPPAPEGSAEAPLSRVYELSLGGRRWLLNVQASAQFAADNHIRSVSVALLAGLVLTSLIATTVLELSGRARNLRHLVDAQTAELDEERQRLANILWGTDVGTWEWNIQTGEIRLNERWAELLGYALQELMPTTIALRMRLAHPDDLEVSTHMVKRHFHEGAPYHCETRLRHRDGRWIWLADRGKVISRTPDGKPLWMAGTLMDINARKVAELTLLASEEKLRGLYELAPLGIALTDSAGRFLEFNHAFVEITGYPRDELAALDYWAITPPEYLEDEQRQLQSLAVSQRYGPYEKEYLRKDGRRISISLNGRVVTGPDGQTYIWSIIEDISSRKAREAERTKLADQLKASNAELEQFAYIASHDLRQPLRMVSGFVQMLQRRLETLLDDESRKMMRFATDGAQRMDQMLLSLLEYSRVGRKGEPMIMLSTRTALEEALRFLAPSIRETDAQIEVVGEWPALVASRDELTRLFQNLIGNAVKYRSPTRRPQVEVGAELHGTTGQFYVRDNGIGIDPKQFERLFRVFQRLHAPGQYEGTGIGLAVVRKIVTRHGGRVWVESQGEDTGTTFFFTLASEHRADDETSLL